MILGFLGSSGEPRRLQAYAEYVEGSACEGLGEELWVRSEGRIVFRGEVFEPRWRERLCGNEQEHPG